MSILRYMKILLASNNAHKKEEFSRILAPLTIALPTELGLTFDFDEDEDTFPENALGKAQALPPVPPDGWAIVAGER